MKYKMIIFDLDGTILNTLDDLAASTNYSLIACGLDTVTTEQVRQFVGNGIRKLIERAVPRGTDEALVDKVFEVFKKYYGEHCTDNTRPYDGIMDALSLIRDSGMRTAVVSNKADFAVKELVDRYFKGMFDYAVGEREGVRRKPYPDSVTDILNKSGIKCDEAVYIGDSQVDIETANNCNMDMIIVDWGFRDREFLKENGAKNIVSDCSELLSLIYN